MSARKRPYFQFEKTGTSIRGWDTYDVRRSGDGIKLGTIDRTGETGWIVKQEGRSYAYGRREDAATALDMVARALHAPPVGTSEGETP